MLIPKFKNFPLRIKLASTYTLLLFIVALATFIYFPEKQKEQVTKALEVKVESTVQMLAIGISRALDEGDYDLIKKVFSLTQEDTNINYIAVLDENGEMIISLNPKEIQTPNIIQYDSKKVLEEQGMIFVTKRLQIEDEIFGSLVIGYSLQGRNKTIAQIRWTGFWISFAIFLFATLISVYLSRQITNPLKNIVDTFEEMGRTGTYGNKMEKGSTDEIGSLIDGFNDMTTKIDTRTEELRISEEKYRSLFEDSKDAIYITEEEKFVDVNLAMQNLLGYTRQELMKMNIGELYVNINDRIKIQQEIEERGSLKGFEVIWQKKDGTKIDILITATPRKTDNVTIVGYQGIIQDITPMKKAEEERSKLQVKLERAERMEALGILAGGVAHDLNNTLVPLLAIPELMLSKLPEDSELREHALLIKRATKRAADTIGDLLTLARRGIYEMKPLNLNSLLNVFINSHEFIEIQKQKPNVILESDFDKDLPNIIGSNAHLSKVVMNLVKNAYEAINQSGRLSIKTSKIYLATKLKAYIEIKPGNYVLLEIEDDGTGIRDDVLHKIFEPFYTDKEMGSSGTGLGLAVVWGVLKDHDAFIDVGTVLGSGTKFSVYFPMSDEIEEAYENDPIYDHGTENILVVDDLEVQRETFEQILSSLGYHVDSVENGHLAIEFVKQHDVDLIVLDMLMEEEFDGLDTYREIKKIKENQKAIIVSGFALNERVEEAMKLGVGKYVRKPYTIEELGKAIRTELDKK